MVVANETGGLQTVDEGILLGQLPVEVGVFLVVPPSVKPDGTNLTIVGKQLGQLVVHKLVIALPVALGAGSAGSSSGASPGVVLAIPVQMRVVEMEGDALAMTLVGEFLENVTLEGSAVYNIIIAVLGLEHRETLVMTSGEADVLGTRRLDSADPLGSVKLSGVETFSELRILMIVQVLVGHSPLASGKHTVEPPVEEDTKAHVAEFLSGLQIVCGGFILGACRCGSKQQCCQRDSYSLEVRHFHVIFNYSLCHFCDFSCAPHPVARRRSHACGRGPEAWRATDCCRQSHGAAHSASPYRCSPGYGLLF